MKLDTGYKGLQSPWGNSSPSLYVLWVLVFATNSLWLLYSNTIERIPTEMGIEGIFFLHLSLDPVYLLFVQQSLTQREVRNRAVAGNVPPSLQSQCLFPMVFKMNTSLHLLYSITTNGPLSSCHYASTVLFLQQINSRET